MSSIPPNANIMGSIVQAQVSASETAKSQDTRKNQRARESKELARLAQQQTDEVENTEQTDEVVVRRQDERNHDGQDARDTYQQHEQNTEGKIYTDQGKTDVDKPKKPPSPDSAPTPQNHIDLSG